MTVLADLDCRLVVGVDFDCDAAIQHITYHYLIDTAYSLITPRQGYVVVVVVAVFTTVIITYYTIISTNSLYIMKLLRSAAAREDSYVDILDHLYLFLDLKAAGKID